MSELVFWRQVWNKHWGNVTPRFVRRKQKATGWAVRRTAYAVRYDLGNGVRFTNHYI